MNFKIKFERIKAVKLGFIALVFMVIGFQSCYENIVGCLDVNATNFEVTADRECEDCCTYPLLRLAVQHIYSDIEKDTSYRFNLEETYTLDSINFFSLTDLRYYLSDIKLVRENGELIGVEEQLEDVLIEGIDTSLNSIEDNFALIDRKNISSSTIGTFRENGSFMGIQFNIGLSSFEQKIAPEFFESSHPLAFGDSLLYDLEEESYLVTRLDLARDTLSMENDTTTIKILAKDYIRNVYLDFDFIVDAGFNTTIALQVDYRLWFEGVDVKSNSEETITKNLKDNIEKSFKVFDVRVAN